MKGHLITLIERKVGKREGLTHARREHLNWAQKRRNFQRQFKRRLEERDLRK